MRSLAEVRKLDPGALLLEMLDWKRRRQLDALVPSHIKVPTGSQIRVDYSDPAAPMIAVRLQEMFGVAESPRVMGGRVSVTVQLLSPAQRPVQTTSDLAGFWRTSYFDVRKEMRGRYPKHHWPENPLEAEPTRRTRRK
jgi:ATP-dependent helicase HrpB